MTSRNAGAVVDEPTGRVLAALAVGDTGVIEQGLEIREELISGSGLDRRTFALVKIAALVALDAPPASYMWQVGAALEAGASAREILGVLTAIAPQAGGPRIVAAAPEIMVALGMSLPDGVDEPAEQAT